MPSSLTILLITLGGAPAAAGGSDDPFTPAIARAAREALGPDVGVSLRTVQTLPSDAEAVELARAAHADAVVEVTWTSPDHTRATIRMERESTGRWLDREIGFRTVDDPAERSRTVGFAIASMLPERASPNEAPRPEAAPTPVESKANTRASPTRKSTPQRAPPKTASPPRDVPPPPDSAQRDGPAAASRETPVGQVRSVAAIAVVAIGVGDRSDSAGGALDYRNALAGAFSLRFSAGARFGFDPPAGVTARFFSGSAGLVLRSWASANGRAALGARLDVLALVDQLERRSDGVTATRNKVMPGVDLLAEASYFFTPGAAVVVAAGAEALFGQTAVIADGRPLTTLEPVHPVVEAGLHIGFQ